MSKVLAKYLGLFTVILIGIFLIFAIFHTGLYSSHDGIFHIYRTEEALSMLKSGQFPLRWAGNFDQGFGIPLFTFVYPLPYYITATLSYIVGSIWSVKSLFIVSYLLGGVGMYQLFIKKDRYVALALALIYLMTPYQFLNIFVRGAIGEVLALGLIPWVLVSFHDLWSSKASRLKWYHPIPFALLLLSHNFLGILFGVFLLGYILTQKLSLKTSITSFLISFGLASFFILPMVLEKKLLYSTDHPDLNFRYDQHFVKANQFIYGKWDYWYSMPPDKEDGMSFQLGVAQIAIAIIGVVYIVVNKKRTKQDLFLILAYCGSIFLMHAKSSFIWEAVPILKSIQFPWRFLFMPAVLTPLLAAPWLVSLKWTRAKYLILIAVLLLGFVNVRNYRRPIKFFDLTEYTDLYRLYLNKTSTTFRSEILPKWSVPNERYKSEDILVNAGNMTIDSFTVAPLVITATINNKPDSSVGRLTILRNYYPGWVATMDGKTKAELTPTGEGMISLEPAIGVHSYVVKMTSTLIEKIANLVTLISLLILGFIWQKSRTQK
ncbi:hypothetical protein KBD75_00510 [Candidatus Woesebacteria bacterium]|nr:hypothetical protein [Candidatus Woesebacteria bacterium]